jgi:hypothetical protein
MDMLSTIYRRGFVPIVTFAAAALVGVGVLLLVGQDSYEHVPVAGAFCGVSLAITGLLLAQSRRTYSLWVLFAAIIGLIATGGLAGALRSTVPGALALVAVLAHFLIAVVATLVRAEAAGTTRRSSIDRP